MRPKKRRLQIVVVGGQKNAGKTQYLLETWQRLLRKGWQTGGFLSMGQMEDSVKMRYYLRNLATGEERLLAWRSPENKGLRIGRYVFDPSVFVWGEQFVGRQLHFPFLILDEFGPLEMQKKGWFGLLRFLLEHYKGTLFISVRPNLLPFLLDLIRKTVET